MSPNKKKNYRADDAIEAKVQPIQVRCELFDPSKADIEVWYLKFQATVSLSQLSDVSTKRNLFVSSLDTAVLKILINLCKPKNISEFTQEQLYEILLKNFKQTTNKLCERVKFFTSKQNSFSLSEFANDLKSKISNCDFPQNFYQDALVTAYVMGINDSKIRSVLLQKDFTLFEEAFELSRTLEMVNLEVTKDNVVSSEPFVHQVARGYCFGCGEKHFRKDCRFKDAICHKCKKKGHISKVCSKQVGLSRVNEVEDNSDFNEVLVVKDVNRLSAIIVPVSINGTNVSMQLDTGSGVSIISETTWVKLGRFPLQGSKGKFSSYSGHQVNILGEQVVQVTYRGSTAQLLLYVASGVTQDLMGREWIFKLRLSMLSLESLARGDSSLLVATLEQCNILNLENLLKQHEKLFSTEISVCSKVTAHLFLKSDVKPVFKKARPVPFSLRDKVSDEIERLVKAGVLEQVEYSNWAAPCVIARKPGGKIRICGDFSTGLNQSLDVQVFPLSTPEEIFAKIGGGSKYSVLDLSDAYLSIPVDEESQNLLVINTHKGLYSYKRLCFGISPAPAIFQKVMYNMLAGLNGVCFFLDDIIVTGKTDEEHLINLREVFNRIKEFGLHLNKNKCKFMESSVTYLGVEISKKGISTTNNKVKAILEMPRPGNIKQLESFLGMINFYSKFIPNFSEISFPLHRLRRKGVTWNWCEECENAFNFLKECLSGAEVLIAFDPNLPIILAADASSVGIGCSLMHRLPDGSERPVAYASKTLTETERKYSQIEREALAIIFAVKKFRSYLWGTKFTLQTDHRPLQAIFGTKKGIPITTSYRLQRWALFLSNFTFDIEYVPTGRFGKVDGLSRLPAGNDKPFEKEEEKLQEVVAQVHRDAASPLSISPEVLAQKTAEDPGLSRVLTYIVEGWPRNILPEIKPYFQRREALSITEGCIFWGIRVVIPQALRNHVLNYLHGTHSGMVRMKAEAREHCWWPGMDLDIERISQQCTSCNIFAPQVPQKNCSSWQKEDQPWNRLHIDFAGPFLNKMFLIVVDAFSKWVEVIPMTSITAPNTVYVMKSLICRYGIPRTIVSDNGRTFTSNEFKRFCEEYSIVHTTTPPYHPASNGQAEKYVGTMKNALKKLQYSNNNTTFQENLQLFLFKYRTTPHITTKITPAELFLGRQVRTQLSSMIPDRHCNTEGSKSKFEEGEKVYYRYNRGTKASQWCPGTIKQRLGSNMWLVDTDDGLKKCHEDQLKRRYQAQQGEVGGGQPKGGGVV